MACNLIVIYGAPLSGKTSVAWQLARSLDNKSAVISVDHLLGGSIAQASADPLAELDMVHTQVRLLVANYMKNGYDVVVEGPFYYEREDGLRRYEQEIDQLIALMRQMTQRALLVQLTAPPEVFESRATRANREPEAPKQIDALYRQRHGATSLVFDTGVNEVEQIAEAIREKLTMVESV